MSMVNRQNIHPLSDFQRNAKSHIKRLRKSGLPEVLTVNGRASIVIQDAASYQRMVTAIERADTIQATLEGVKQAQRGETIPLDEFDKKMRRKHKIGARRPA
jgi:PHD/YefM family antitoxin component YafN of YafNO toxin-antitoxin module